jgi:hypothetical protein
MMKIFNLYLNLNKHHKNFITDVQAIQILSNMQNVNNKKFKHKSTKIF